MEKCAQKPVRLPVWSPISVLLNNFEYMTFFFKILHQKRTCTMMPYKNKAQLLILRTGCRTILFCERANIKT